MTTPWNVVEQYHIFAVLLLVFQFYPVCNSGKFINFGRGTARIEMVKQPNILQCTIGSLRVVYVFNCRRSTLLYFDI